MQAWVKMTDGDFFRFFRKSAHSTREEREFKRIVYEEGRVQGAGCRVEGSSRRDVGAIHESPPSGPNSVLFTPQKSLDISPVFLYSGFTDTHTDTHTGVRFHFRHFRHLF